MEGIIEDLCLVLLWFSFFFSFAYLAKKKKASSIQCSLSAVGGRGRKTHLRWRGPLYPPRKEAWSVTTSHCLAKPNRNGAAALKNTPNPAGVSSRIMDVLCRKGTGLRAHVLCVGQVAWVLDMESEGR